MRFSFYASGALAAAMVLAFSGCLEEERETDDTTYPVVACDASEACPDGSICHGGHCIPECASDADCPADAECVDGACELLTEVVECTADADCPAHSVCVDGECLFHPDPTDADGDGYVVGDDCDDADPSVSPGAAEICDGLDNDCDGEVDEEGCHGCVDDSDCDDGDPSTDDACESGLCTHTPDHCLPHEICDDGLDNDCDGEVDEDCDGDCVDEDGDGYGVGADCEGHDCDDADASVSPGAAEICDGLDNDCDGEVDEEGCDPSECAEDLDCDDGDPDTDDSCDEGLCLHAPLDCFPHEICGDGLDNDCNGVVDDGC